MSQQHYIDGQWVAGEGRSFDSKNPATGEVIWQGTEASAQDVNAAVAAARKAFPAWAALSIELRFSYLEKFQAALKAKKEEFTLAISQETGKPLWEAKTEVGAAINKIDISLEAYHKRSGEVTGEAGGAKTVTRHRPHGVIAVIGPFNFPLHLPNGHIIPALLAGNTLVLKPSEQTPMVSEMMMQCWDDVRLPVGVLNMVQGARQTGEALTSEDIDGLFFTGSYATGKALHAQLAGQPEKIIALEMGGNNPLIVHEVGDVDAAVYHTIQSAFITAGQRCTCARRLIVPLGQEGDQFLEKLVTATNAIHVAPYTEQPEPFIGSLISADAAKNILATQDGLVNQGGVSLVKAASLAAGTGLVSPGIIDVTNIAAHKDEEYFGPLLQVIRSQDFNDAIHIANNTKYGLSAGLLSDNKEHFNTFYRQAHAGLINWNRPLTGAASNAPFGGIGRSGNHRPSAYYAADYCAYPVASMFSDELSLPADLSPGIKI